MAHPPGAVAECARPAHALSRGTTPAPVNEPERDLGEQPLKALLARLDLRSADLVAASTEQLTHKMVARGCKGRRLTPNTMGKVHRALEAASGERFALDQLFTYAPAPRERDAGRD